MEVLSKSDDNCVLCCSSLTVMMMVMILVVDVVNVMVVVVVVVKVQIYKLIEKLLETQDRRQSAEKKIVRQEYLNERVPRCERK